MPRRNKRRNKRSKKPNNSFVSTNSVRVHIRQVSETTLSAGAATITVSPAMSPQSTQYADAFQMYRVTRLRFRLMRTTTTTATQSACYLPGVTDNSPSSAAAAAAVPASVILPLTATVPTRWCNVPSNILSSYMNWYKTVVGSPDAAEEIQGNIYVRGGATDQYLIEIDAIMDFRVSVPTGVTPMTAVDRGRLERDKERQRILNLLAGTSAPSTVSGIPRVIPGSALLP